MRLLWAGLITALFTSSPSLVKAHHENEADEDTLAFSPPFYPSPWADGSGEWEAAYLKAKDFVSQLTLVEKVNLTTGTGWQLDQCVGQTGGIPRIDFPPMCMQDGPLGVRYADQVSVFPAGVNVAATWSKELAFARGEAMGTEHRRKGVDAQLGPSVSPLGRSPLGGRNWEGFSIDPVISAKLAAETVKGIQSAGVMACMKHLIVNEQERFRSANDAAAFGYHNVTKGVSSNVDDKTMHELYLWPFADAIRAGLASVMCSYQQINNSNACSNSYTMNKLLKSELGFQGFVMSDWQATHSGVGDILAGLDMSMPGDTLFDTGVSYFGANLTIAVLNGTIPQWRVDDMAVRIMTAYYQVGRDHHKEKINFSSWDKHTNGYRYAINQDGPYGQINEHLNVRDDHARLIREIGAKSAVLLKNEECALPLSGKEAQVGVFGEDAGPNPNGANSCSDRGCATGTVAEGWGSGSVDYPYLITPYEAIQREVVENNGAYFAVLNDSDVQQTQQVASTSQVALAFVVSDSGEGYINVDGNIGDRNNLTLWRSGTENVIQNIAAYCNNTIVIIHSPGPVLLDEFEQHPNITAIVWVGFPGQESGNSLVDVLYGRVNPAGKSPFTWGKSLEDYGTKITTDVVSSAIAPQSDFTEGIFVDYRHFDKEGIEPVYPFGFGLSYTDFEYSNLNVKPIAAPGYTPSSGKTQRAFILTQPEDDPDDSTFPGGFEKIEHYIYPFINSTDLRASSGDSDYGMDKAAFVPEHATDDEEQEILAAGGAPGGNPRLWDDLYEVSVEITNTGGVVGDAVPQLYVSLGGPDEAMVVLRDFARIPIGAGETHLWRTTLTRRDVSNWDVVRQDWTVTDHQKAVFVGSHSRDLPLKMDLPGTITLE